MGIFRALFPICRRRVVFPRPLGPTRPYRRPDVILSFAFLNKSLPPADIEKSSMSMSSPSTRASLAFSRWETAKLPEEVKWLLVQSPPPDSNYHAHIMDIAPGDQR